MINFLLKIEILIFIRYKNCEQFHFKNENILLDINQLYVAIISFELKKKK